MGEAHGRTRRRVILIGATAVAVTTGIYLPVTLLAPIPTVSADVSTIVSETADPATPVLPGFGVSGITAIGETGALAAADDGAAHPIASITKTITALVSLRAQPMDPAGDGQEITLTARDQAFYEEQIALGGNVEPVPVGAVLTQRDLLEVVLLPSANNYAQTLAAWAFGSEAAYLDAARAWLVEHGMASTTIVDASGVDDANTSTVGDLLILGQLVLDDPVLAPIVSSTAAEVPDLGIVENSNRLLGIAGVDGIKTGTAPLAGACLLFAADVVVGSTTVPLVGVVLGGDGHPAVRDAVVSLIESVVAGYREVEVVPQGQPIAEYSTVWGQTSTAVARESVAMLVWSDTPVEIAIDTIDLTLAEAGQSVGSVTVTSGARSSSVDLVLESALTDPGAWWRLTNPGTL